jgi:hypothetical protein
MLARCLTFALIVAVAAAEVRNTRRCDAPALPPRTFRRAAACACKTADRAPKLQGPEICACAATLHPLSYPVRLRLCERARTQNMRFIQGDIAGKRFLLEFKFK